MTEDEPDPHRDIDDTQNLTIDDLMFADTYKTTQFNGPNGELIKEWHPCGCLSIMSGSTREYTVCQEHLEVFEDVLRGRVILEEVNE